MLPPVHRLKKEKEIKRALDGRMRAGNNLLVCRAAPNDLGVARFCFAVSKKVSNKAAVRNLLKRRLRAAAAVMLARIKPGFDCVLIARSGLEGKTYQEIYGCLYGVLAKSNLLADSKTQNKK